MPGPGRGPGPRFRPLGWDATVDSRYIGSAPTPPTTSSCHGSKISEFLRQDPTSEGERSHTMTTDEQTNQPKSNEQTKQPKSNDRPFVRWQQIRITQFGIVSATVLTLATAALGFGLTQRPPLSGCELCALRGGLVLLVASVVFALWCALTRLWDFRKTAQIGRLKEKSCCCLKCEKCEEILLLRVETRKLGERTWYLLYWQLGTFAVGAVLLIGAFFPW